VDPQLLRGGFRIGILIVLVALVMLPFQPRGSAEFFVTVLAAAIGGLFLLGITALVRWSTPRIPEPDDKPAGTSYNHADRASGGRSARAKGRDQ
jgi:hypothetical protein